MTATLARLLARGLFLALLLASATLCLVVDIPFTYQAVVRAKLLTGLPQAMTFLPWALAFAAGAALLSEVLPSWRRTWPAAVLPALALLSGIVLGTRGWLSSLEPGLGSRVGTLAFLGAGAIQVASSLWRKRDRWPKPAEGAEDSRRLLHAALGTALILGLGFFAIGTGRALASGTAPTVRVALTTLFWSLITHALLCTLVAVAAFGLQATAGFFPRRPSAEFLFLLGGATAAIAALLQTVVFPGMAFSGPASQAVGWLLGFCLAGSVAEAGLQLGRRDGTAKGSLDLLLRPFHPLTAGRTSLFLALLAASTLALLVALRISRYDWNHLFQQLGAVGVGLLVAAALYRRPAAPVPASPSSVRLFIVALACLAAYRMWALPRLEPGESGLPRPLARAVESHVGFDASARLAYTLMRPAGEGTGSIYRTLLANSNIPQTVPVTAKDLRLVEWLEPSAGNRPDIYIIVVDSLRQDYLGAYNRKVTFTPNLDRFASESAVVRKAFTRYGATGLSEPSIWVGGMILHKQYIVPFHPLNTLQKLISAEGYTPYLSMDSILDVVVKSDPRIQRLDEGKDTSDLRLGPTLAELQTRLDKAPKDQPVFVYTQPQDLHISVINREGKNVLDPGGYEGFYAPYASRVRRLDGQFGTFIQHLKDRGRYDNSIVIFTADHGDSLGEEGRFGHAYTLFPEIMKVPMLIHVPDRLKAGLVQDEDHVSFLTDLAPTLYYLLGHRPLASNPILGRPIFATKEEHLQTRRDNYLLASSYGAVWALLSGDGRSLYISDGVNFVDYAYELNDTPGGERITLTAEAKRRYDRAILQELDHLNTFYRFTPGKGTP